MAVKRSQSASRVLSIVELIATHQPIGVSALARLLQDDKSAVQRAVMTLADAGWIRMAPEQPVRWELSAHIFTIAHLPQSANDLRQRARRTLEALRDEFSETVFLAIPDIGRFVVIDVAESPNALRAPLRVSEVIPVRGSATARAVLPFLTPERLKAMLGAETPDPADAAEFAATRARGYGLSADEVMQGSTILAAPIFDSDGQPIASIGVSGLSERITADRHARIGALTVAGARGLSRGAPRAELRAAG
ncbi:IclR family transcriptional regulator [Phenylobacterium sp. LjRoot219]|uniref:IclR family transcriptional regulator n=1 Tax=Phenylobacterium sp. LjRoot219 TaxID=3342283 RepID=UPI003ECFA766